MLILDDDDELPTSPSDDERALAAKLGEAGVKAIDDALVAATAHRWLKVARIIHEAVRAGKFDVWEDSHVHLHLRRLMALVECDVLEAQGNLRKPRWSEVRRRL